MQTKVKGMNGILMIAVLLIVFLFPLDVSAAETASAALVGYYEDGDYMYHNAQGEYEGYNFEFLQEVSKLSGLSYEVVDSPSWQEAFQLLIDGRIDILPAVYRTEGRMDQMLFTDESMCTIYTTLNVRMDDNRYNYEDFDAFQGMRVGIIKGVRMAKVSNATVRRTALRSPSLNMMRRRNCWTRLGAGPWMVWQLPTWAAAVCSAVLRGLPRPQCTLRSRNSVRTFWLRLTGPLMTFFCAILIIGRTFMTSISHQAPIRFRY